LHFDENTYLQHQMVLPEGWRQEIQAQQGTLDRETI
jgi:hypothetical protein